jgi:hypothetical protein
MALKNRKTRFKICKTYTVEPMPPADRQTAERILVKLVARAYAADHLELFGVKRGEGVSDAAEDRDKGESRQQEGEGDEGSTE